MSQQTPTVLDERAHATEAARAKLQQLIGRKGIKPFKADEWTADSNSESAHQTPEEIRAEVDDFLRLRQEWRAEEAGRDAKR